MELWKQAKQYAKALRGQLHTLDTAAATHGECLDLVARMHGSADWNTYFAKVQRRHFYDRHLPYLPNNPEFVRAMSVRRAVLADLADLEVRKGKQGTKEMGPAFFVQAMNRAMQQAQATFKNKVLAAPTVRAALEAPATKTTTGLLNAEELALQSMNGAMVLFNSESYGSYVSQTDQVAEAYHTTYLGWRLATLARAWGCCVFKPTGKPSLAELLESGADLFDVAGEVLRSDLANKPENVSATSNTQAVTAYERVVGKTVLLSLLANGSMESSLRFDSGVVLDNANVLGKKLLARFPEIELWQAWAELKPLLVEGVDSIAL